MLVADCPVHGRRVLLPLRHLLPAEPGADGVNPDPVVYRLRCWCGAIATWTPR